MMRRLLTTILLLTLTIGLWAQHKPKFNPEAYRRGQKAYILANASLTSDEAEKFFSIYDAMRQRERQLFDKIRFTRGKRPTTAEECRRAVENKDATEIQLKKIQQQYHQKMLRALPPQKVMQCLFLAEKFDREMLRHGRQKP